MQQPAGHEAGGEGVAQAARAGGRLACGQQDQEAGPDGREQEHGPRCAQGEDPGGLQEQGQDEADHAEGADARVAHDFEPAAGGTLASRPSQQSPRPSRCSPPVSAAHRATTSTAVTGGVNQAWPSAKAAASRRPMSRPTSGNQRGGAAEAVGLVGHGAGGERGEKAEGQPELVLHVATHYAPGRQRGSGTPRTRFS